MDQHLETTSTALNVSGDQVNQICPRDRYPPKTSTTISTRPREPDKSSAQSDLCCSLELNQAMLVLSGQRRTAPRLSLVSPKVFFLHFCHWWSFGFLPLLPLACFFGDAWLIAQTLLEKSWTGWWHHWIINKLTLAGKITLCYCPLALLKLFSCWHCKAALTQSILYKALYK